MNCILKKDKGWLNIMQKKWKNTQSVSYTDSKKKEKKKENSKEHLMVKTLKFNFIIDLDLK